MSRASKTPAATGWVRYRICDRSGSGWKVDRWYFSPGVEEYSADERRDEIVRQCESWAIHAERYSFEQWIGETPSIEMLRGCIAGKERERSYLADQIKILERQVELKTELTPL